MEKLLSIGQTAKILGCSVDTLRRWDKSGRFLAVRRSKKRGSHRYYRLSDLEEFSKTLDGFRLAKKWMADKKGLEPLAPYYCSNSYVFQARLSRMEKELGEKGEARNFFPLLVAVAGEIGNNSFDHNLGNWPDIAGAFFNYNLDKREIVLADRGQGILKTLRQVRPKLKNHTEALRTAFTEIISGRLPEHRGNGLKYVKEIVTTSRMKLFFQTGNAQLNLNKKNSMRGIRTPNFSLRGCLAKIEF